MRLYGYYQPHNETRYYYQGHRLIANAKTLVNPFCPLHVAGPKLTKKPSRKEGQFACLSYE
jgi:hypothetical protein